MKMNRNKMAPSGSGEGNTSLPRISASKFWCFTYHFEKDGIDPLELERNEMARLETLFNVLCDKWIIGSEICPSTQRRHFQGFCGFKQKCRPIEKIEPKKIHWEKTKGNSDDNYIYCSKEGKFKSNFSIPKPVIDPLKDLTLKPFQQEIIDILKEPVDNRKIYWYWDKDGNVGKTSLCKHIAINYNSIVLTGKANDIKSGVATHINLKKELNVALFHYARSNEEYVSYEALENIKDGMFFSGKYESSMCLFNPPHVIVFANFAPDTEQLSKDRWIVKNI